ncbi:MAG: ABC transporter substrate-binding protein [Saprospiraceae bacterium]|nr:ABC transporter substrate-binding protein [Saprospiraceae bacterium]MDZ4702413.1 ABC transporter substrate-binding protein [Saprospiraceae bacterium]
MRIPLHCFLFATVLLLAGCMGDSDEKKLYVHSENTVFARLPGEPDRLSPLITVNSYSRTVNELLFLNLLQFDPATLELQPQLAKSRAQIAEITDGLWKGGIAYTFELHESAVWDNGAPITGNDVLFTFKALFVPQVNSGPARSYLDFVKDLAVDAANPKRFTVYTDRKYILGEAAISTMPVYPEYHYDEQGRLRNYTLKALADPEQAARLSEDTILAAFAENMHSERFAREKDAVKGAGAYALQEWVTGKQIALKRKANWWGDALSKTYPMLRALPERLVFSIIPDQVTALAALKSQEIDVASQIDVNDFVEIRKDSVLQPLYNFYTPAALQLFYIGINTRNPKLNDKRVRRALAHTLDMDAIIRDLYAGMAQRVTGPFHPDKPYYHKNLAPIAYNVEQARTLLKAAGWEDTNGNGVADKVLDGKQTELELNYLASSASKFSMNLALVLKDNAAKAGIQINILPKEFPVLIESLKRREFELHGGAWVAEPLPDDPKQLWHTESNTPDGGNRVGFGNAASDALIDEIRVTLDEQKRAGLYRKFQELVYEEQPCIFLLAPQERLVIHKRFDARPSVLRPGFFVNEFAVKR